ncbi:hypothetical protein EPO05_06265 [Patescibacteria group bacterium]|nr:MAG: hypothetical protein EPO05_06265 [Patescibacteria group bacterium]
MRWSSLFIVLAVFLALCLSLTGAKSGVNVYVRTAPYQVLDFEAIEKPNSMDVAVVVHAGTTQRFSSDLSGVSVPITWTVSNGVGSIDNDGVYSPPLTFLSGAQATVQATTVSTPRQSGSVLIILR